MGKIVGRTELIIKTTMEDGTMQTIRFDLSDVQINQSRDMSAIYDEDGEIIEYVETPGKEGVVNITVKGTMRKKYEN